ncbi:phage tail protein [Marinicella meishanensis]|uniref:phage tail protein n=1 Tax=Marinicella meishanensis TaxID=2873263 RepID=UPI001CC150E9|nr:tail fiber protein [Marinicella sp. NBU2979]
MSEPFLAEIRMMGFNFAPRGWAFCDGQILPINQNQSLYSLLGTTYGGDGRTSFALPDLRGRAPIHVGSDGGSTFTEGQKSGEENHTLAANEMPQHGHTVNTSANDGNAPIPVDNTLGGFNNGYNGGSNPVSLSNEVTNAGGGQAHNNMQPTLAVNFCIALQGLFPPRN